MSDKSRNHSKMLSGRLGQAINNGELEHVRMYIEQGADVNRQCYSEMNEEWYPLALACLRRHEEIVVELIKAGADPNQVSGWRRLPAMLIATDVCALTLSMMRCLISHGADVDFRDISGVNILHYLVRGQFSDTRDNLLSAAKLVLDNGASVDARDQHNRTPLHWACVSGNIDLVKLFLAEGADVNCNTGDKTMLRMAVDWCNIDMFDSLINAGANRHLHPDALINPCDHNNRAMIARILDTCDVDINLKMSGYHYVHTILLRACWFRDITSETVRLLLDRGAAVRTVSDTGDTALHYAAMHCDCNKIRQLLAYNHPLNIKNNENQTPLAKVRRCLIDHYSQTNTQYLGSFYAAWHKAGLLAYKMLVTAGAKITADVEHNLNQFHIKHPEAQLPDYEVRSTRSLKEMCRFVIRGTIPVPVDVSLCKLPIPKLLQEYMNFPECDQLVDKYLNLFASTVATTTTSTTTTTASTITASTSTTSTSTSSTTATTNDDIDNIDD